MTVRNHPVIKQNYGLTYKALLKCDYSSITATARMRPYGCFLFYGNILIKARVGTLAALLLF